MAKRKKESAEQISPEKVAKIRADIASWTAGRWAADVAYGPACVCGMRRATCYRHPWKRET